MAKYPLPNRLVLDALQKGLVIPAHPLALTHERRLDMRRQQALTRYYHAAGAGGIAVGVHTTQFAIRDSKHGLLESVLALVAETVVTLDLETNRRTVLIAGICGKTPQAIQEARLARDLGYDIGLLSLASFPESDDETLLGHCRTVAREIPLMGFYLQPAAGGRLLSSSFWRQLAEIPNLVAIKIAPFNRYHTLDVIRGVAQSGRASEIALYTGNDDHIVVDLLTEFVLPVGKEMIRLSIVGGLLGHWACWTRRAVQLLEQCQAVHRQDAIPADLLTLAAQVTDANAALFDAANGFAGATPGIHEVLHRQGLLANTLCLDPEETLSPGQSSEIDRVYAAYPALNDDEFVREHLDEWLN